MTAAFEFVQGFEDLVHCHAEALPRGRLQPPRGEGAQHGGVGVKAHSVECADAIQHGIQGALGHFAWVKQFDGACRRIAGVGKGFASRIFFTLV